MIGRHVGMDEKKILNRVRKYKHLCIFYFFTIFEKKNEKFRLLFYDFWTIHHVFLIARVF